VARGRFFRKGEGTDAGTYPTDLTGCPGRDGRQADRRGATAAFSP